MLRSLALSVALASFLLLPGCTGSQPRFTPSPGDDSGEPGPLEGVASYYSDEYNGRPTSSGEIYDMHAMTAAHRTLPFGTRVLVHNLDNGKSVEVRINDRGPFKAGRIIDVSLEAAKRLGMIGPGTARVRLELLP
jgi:peptidoglycan lytic transglycosylase